MKVLIIPEDQALRALKGQLRSLLSSCNELQDLKTKLEGFGAT